MSKADLEKEYRQALAELQAAHDEDEMKDAWKIMKRLEDVAAQEYGDDFADYLYNDLFIGDKWS